jgi:hypothetical protein
MADVIKCPKCGESNLSDQEFCQYCRSRLQPPVSSTKAADGPIRPGQFPTKKNTAELEPILPQWLRDARDSARKSAEDDAAQSAKQPQSPPASSTPDLLAGLQSQTENEEDETPDWLASITGVTPKSKKNQTEPAEVRWVELGDANDFAKDESTGQAETPTWMAGAPTAGQPQANEKDELTDWFRSAGNSNEPLQPGGSAPFDAVSASPNDGSSDWLKEMAADNMRTDGESGISSNAAPSDTPEWLRQISTQDGQQNNQASKPAFDSSTADMQDWLKQLPSQDDPKINPASPNTSSAAAVETPDWLSGIGGVRQDQAAGVSPFGTAGSTLSGSDSVQGTPQENVPEWLKGLPSLESKPITQEVVPTWLKEEPSTPDANAEVPAWLSGTAAPVEPPASQKDQFFAPDNTPLGDLPSWLQAAAPQDSIFDAPASELPSDPVSGTSSDNPDWLNAFKSVDGPQQAPAFSMDPPSSSTPPAFTQDIQDAGKSDALFTDMPDWLSSVTDAPAPANPAPPNPSSAAIIPGELPSWVQAMRPVDTSSRRPVTPTPSATSITSSVSSDQTLESRGVLAGLQGVLPSVPGYAPTSKPKAYSIKLQASDEQQSHAALLEQILAAETEPVPIASFSTLRTSRSLRWGLSFVLLAVLMTVSLIHSQIFPLPLGVPVEITKALQVTQSLPESAPVLVAFDYEPARVGEMEAAATQLISLLKKPRLTFISTNATGAALAEHIISGPLNEFIAKSGFPYLNAGYLPGGHMGIRAFAQDPFSAMPQLSDITSFSQFAEFIIITDSADDARSWIEQTSFTHGTTPIVVVSSAQAAPMIQPYFESQQISGLVSGLYGSAVLEQNNPGGSNGAARTYWDAFSIGMLLAMISILGGGLVSLALGLRDRAAAREEK